MAPNAHDVTHKPQALHLSLSIFSILQNQAFETSKWNIKQKKKNVIVYFSSPPPGLPRQGGGV
jgi:hypothetical protein